MQGRIQQKKVAIGDKYRIYLRDKLIYKGARKLLRVFSTIVLEDQTTDKTAITIKKRLKLFGIRYILVRPDTYELTFKTLSWLRRHYRCWEDNTCYDIYGHTGRRYSVFKDDMQIAAWEHRMLSVGEGDDYELIMDDNSDALLIFSFCIALDDAYRQDQKGLFSFDMGNWNMFSRRNDKHWQPAKDSRVTFR